MSIFINDLKNVYDKLPFTAKSIKSFITLINLLYVQLLINNKN